MKTFFEIKMKIKSNSPLVANMFHSHTIRRVLKIYEIGEPGR